MFMSKAKGFTLIELVIVIAILSILSAIAVPKYIDLQSAALIATKAGMSGSVKSAFAIAIAENRTYPTVTQLASDLSGENVLATNIGVQVTISGDNYTVPTYIDTGCTIGTTSVNNTVMCVGSIP
jgi:MSHA pilin protein MshA